ncbi:GDP-L-fucose synthase [bacterium]|nr:GDP-L-fucose synthase [bacterium]
MVAANKHAKIYIAGHTGLLGSSLRRMLISHGYHNLMLHTRSEINLTDSCAVTDFLSLEKPDCIILCAAKVGGIQANIADPVHFLAENLSINLNVICSALHAGVRNLIYIGSSCMYPRDYKTPLKEEYLLAAPLEPTNEGYALAKIAGAKLCEYCASQYGVCYKTLIPCNLYGPGDKFDPASSHLIAAVIDKLHRAKTDGKSSVEIWGDGSARREFLYVEDLADYICRCIGQLDETPAYMNIGYGEDFSVLDYYKIAAEVIGFDGEFTFDISRPVGMSTKLLDSSRARLRGWKPSTTLYDGILKTYQYYLDKIGGSER